MCNGCSSDSFSLKNKWPEVIHNQCDCDFNKVQQPLMDEYQIDSESDRDPLMYTQAFR